MARSKALYVIAFHRVKAARRGEASGAFALRACAFHSKHSCATSIKLALAARSYRRAYRHFCRRCKFVVASHLDRHSEGTRGDGVG